MNTTRFMLKFGFFIVLISTFLVGWLSNVAYSELSHFEFETPFTFTFKADEINSPSDHVKEEQIKVYNDRVIIDLNNPQWAKFTDTNSMDPMIDAGTNSIEIKPKLEDIHVGDIISYKPENVDYFIVHRIVEINEDEQGWYCKVKGDNLTNNDPGKIRFEQINGLVVALIY